MQLGAQRSCARGVGPLGTEQFIKDGRCVASAADGIKCCADSLGHVKISSSFLEASNDVRYDFRFVAEPLLGWTSTAPSRDEN